MGDVDGGGTTSPVMPNSSGGESSQDELESPEQENLLMGDEPEQGRNNLLQGIPLDQQVHHDPFQLPLVGAGALGGPPVLPMGGAVGAMQGGLSCEIMSLEMERQLFFSLSGAGAMQGMDGGQGRGQPGHVMGAVPRYQYSCII